MPMRDNSAAALFFAFLLGAVESLAKISDIRRVFSAFFLASLMFIFGSLYLNILVIYDFFKVDLNIQECFLCTSYRSCK